MTNSSRLSVTRTQSGDRFYNPPAVRRQRQMLLQQQQEQEQEQEQLLKKVDNKPSSLKEARMDSVEVDSRTGTGTRNDSDEAALSRPNSVSSASPPRTASVTNLDRLMKSVTPFVKGQFVSEARRKGRKMNEADRHPFFGLGDLWECFREWSVYGVGVPVLLNGNDSVNQYYVPYLSGIQLYVDPKKLRRPGDKSEVDSSRETSSAGNSDCEAERRGSPGHQNIVVNKHTLEDNKPSPNSSNDDAKVSNDKGELIFEFFEPAQPHSRKPLYEKVSSLASEFPELNMYRSCDLTPSSWVSVAWYPIYRIPVGQTLHSLEACFLTFHSLSTDSRSKNHVIHNADGSSRQKMNGVDAAASVMKISLPVFGLASYKLKNSIMIHNDEKEWKQVTGLLQAADNWLVSLEAKHPDFQFFVLKSTWK